MNRQEQLIDTLLRHQLYLEGVRLYFSAQYLRLLKQLYAAFVRFFLSSGYNNLGELSRTQLLIFLSKFQVEQQTIYRQHKRQLFADLKALLFADLKLSEEIFQSFSDKQASLANGDEVWTYLEKEPIPANGLLLSEQVDRFNASAMAGVISLIRKGYANNWTNDEALTAIVGSKDTKFSDGLFAKLNGQNSAIAATLIQFVSSEAQARQASQLFEQYVWVSVIDNRTTPICIERNGKVYVYGIGPLPPAHYNCRSKAVPWFDIAFEMPGTVGAWLSTQSTSFQQDIQARKALTIQQFSGKLDSILGGIQ